MFSYLKKAAPFAVTLLLSLALSSEAARTLIGDLFYLKPSTLPASGKDGMLRVDSADNKLKKYSESASAWEEITGGGGTGGGGVNFLADSNFGFEDSTTAVAPWTSSGTGTFTVVENAAISYLGDQGPNYGSCDAGAAGFKCFTEAVDIPPGFKGKSCLYEQPFRFDLGTDGHYTIGVEDGAGNDITSTVDVIETTNNQWKLARIFFNCPESGQVQGVIEGTNASAVQLRIDEAYLGSNKNLFQISDSEVVFSGLYETTVNCEWLVAAVSYTTFGVDTDCPGITTEFLASGYTLDSTDDDLPTLKFSNVPPGRYVIRARVPLKSSVANDTSIALRRTDTGPTILREGLAVFAGTNNSADQILEAVVDQLEAGPMEFDFVAASPSGNIRIDLRVAGAAEGLGNLSFTVLRYPLNPTSAIITEGNNGWYIDATSEGGNFSIGTATDNVFRPVTSGGSQVLTVRSGSSDAFISCDGTEVGSGTTCTAAENIGIVFDAPYKMNAEGCISFSERVVTNNSGDYRSQWRLVRRDNANELTVLQAGDHELENRTSGQSGDVHTKTMKVCDTFQVEGGLNTIELQHKIENAANINSANLLTGSNISNVRYTIKEIGTQPNQLVAIDGPPIVEVLYQMSGSTSNPSIAFNTIERVDYDVKVFDRGCTGDCVSGAGTANWAFTAPRDGFYFIEAALQYTSLIPSGTGRLGALYLWDDSANIAIDVEQHEQVSNNLNTYMQGSKMIYLNKGETTYINAFTNVRDATASTINTNLGVTWVSIHEVTSRHSVGGDPIDNATSPGTGGKVCAARITPGLTTFSGQTCNFISSVTANGTGDSTVNFVPGFWTDSPRCTATGVSSAVRFAQLHSGSTTSSVRFLSFNSTPAAITVAVNIICIGQ